MRAKQSHRNLDKRLSATKSGVCRLVEAIGHVKRSLLKSHAIPTGHSASMMFVEVGYFGSGNAPITGVGRKELDKLPSLLRRTEIEPKCVGPGSAQSVEPD